eukprot:CAMPEP_0183300626 /NCGR_PEP_ID=MMETSP0160_2-20130417/6984_1 /TAXON_ID=2839 ORGANISM="Odontella Sinensis, Strain Grunow 1884" /NCGR_SAMPLE_ID=MMETSP0160_2 /ASSEMBLY_ACC=CAM_ASM_000250 /LENGTH=73 /DNA_ID=CAMNT_0025463073 /DNA_START=80 /DNA_END=301 /DNA_ORIENTATION=-
MIDEAEEMLLHGIVQGQLNPSSGNYEVKIKPEHTSEDSTTNMEPITTETTETKGCGQGVVVTSTKGEKEKSGR